MSSDELTKKKAVLIAVAIVLTFIVVFALVYAASSWIFNSSPKTATFTIQIQSNTSWSGSIGTDGSSKSIEGFGNGAYTLKGWVVSAAIQKQTERGSLTVKIIEDGRVVDSQTTTAAYGVVTVAATA